MDAGRREEKGAEWMSGQRERLSATWIERYVGDVGLCVRVCVDG